MEFPYSKSNLRTELILAITNLAIGLILISVDSSLIFFKYAITTIGVVALFSNFKKRRNSFIKLDGYTLNVYDPIFWSDIIDVSEFKRAEMTDTSIILWLDDFKRTVKTDQLSKTDRHKLFDQINNILQNSVKH